MGRYASKTNVGSDQSQAEIKRTLRRYGAGQFVAADDWEGGRVMVGFVYQGMMVRFTLTMPRLDEREFTHTPAADRPRSEAKAHQAWEQACRQRWRALAVVIKAKLEAVDSSITTFEQEFMAHLVLPGGQTVGEKLLPQITEGIQAGHMPRRLPLFDTKDF